MQVFLTIIVLSFLFLSIIGIASISGMYSERVGIANIAIEGMMTIGAVVYGLVAHLSKIESPWMQLPLLLIAGAAGGLFASLHGFVTIKLKGDHIISGVALNLLAPALAFLMIKAFGTNNRFDSLVSELAISKNAAGGDWKNIFSLKLVFLILIAVASIILLNKTKWGLRLRSIGENPQAADVAGVNVNAYKWQGLTISGFLAGLAGGFFFQYVGQAFSGGVNGLGFLALAVLIMGRWKTSFIVISAVLFSFIYSLSVVVGAGQAPFENLKEYSKLIFITPYVLTLLILIFTSKNSAVPKAVGLPYDKSKR